MKKNCTSADGEDGVADHRQPTVKKARKMLAPSRVAASKISRGTARKYVAIMNTVSGRPIAM